MEFLINTIKQFFDVWMNHKNSSTAVKTVAQSSVEAKKADAVIPQAAPAVPQTNDKFCLPATTVVTSNFETRFIFNQKQWHGGLDMGVAGGYGTPIKCVEAGTVIMNKQATTPDKLTLIAVRGDFTGCYLYYCHVGSKENTVSALVQVGQHVQCGEVIGFANSTGMTTGPHIHMGCYTRTWVCVDFGLYLKKYAPGLFAKLTGYRFSGEVDNSNKTGRPEADL